MATGGVAAAAATSWADDLSTLDQLFAEARAYRFTKEYRELITFIGRFPNYAPYNCFLLHTQNPGVQYVLNAKQWRERFRRCVVDGAGPLVVLVRFGPVDFVYDLLDTTGPEVPPAALDPFRAVGDLPQTAWDMTIGNCERDLVKVVDISAHTNRAGSIGTAEPEDTVWGIV